MRSDSWVSLQQTFNRAVELEGTERAAYLDDACRDRPELRDQVDALLAAHEHSSAFLDSATTNEAETTLPESPVPHTPNTPDATPTIPGFRIICELSRGGMGIVYEAERLHPRQTVALKLLKPSFAQPSLRRRFEHEIHLLARLQHPGISQIYDAGVTPSPLGPIPYFAMELVQGRPLDEAARDESIPCARASNSLPRSPTPCSTRISGPSSTATSSRATSSSRPKASRKSSTSASPARSTPTSSSPPCRRR